MCDSFATPWTIACKPLLSMEFSRQEYWSGLPFPSPGDLPNPGTELRSPALQVDVFLHSSILALQYSCPENPMDGGAWWATVHGVTESVTAERLHFHFPCQEKESLINQLKRTRACCMKGEKVRTSFDKVGRVSRA